MSASVKKNIWYISKYFAPKTNDSPGGRGWFLLRELQNLGYDATVLTSDSNNLCPMPTLSSKLTMESVEGVTVAWLKTLKYKKAKSFRRMASWIHFEYNVLTVGKNRFSKPDLIIASSLSLFSILSGLYLKKKYNCKLIFEVRDIWPLTIVEEGGFNARNPFIIALAFIEKIGYKYSDAIIGTMPNLGKHVENVLGHAKEAYCIPMGIDASHINSQEAISNNYMEKHVPKGQFILGYAGTIGITNALNTLFEAATRLASIHDIHFLIIGDGALKEQYKSKYGHLKNITFAPKIAKNKVHSALQVCDAVYLSVFRSEVWKYGQSLNKVIDYMLSGKPIIASYSGYPSMINEADCGFLVPAEETQPLVDAILKLHATSVEDRAKIGERGREWILLNRNYTQLGKDFADIIEKTLSITEKTAHA